MSVENRSPSTRRRVSSVVTNVFPSQKTDEACDTGATGAPRARIRNCNAAFCVQPCSGWAYTSTYSRRRRCAAVARWQFSSPRTTSWTCLCDDGDPWKLVRRGCGVAGFGHLTVWVRGKPRGVSADYYRRLVSLWSHQIDSQALAKRGHQALGTTRNLLTHNVTSTHNLIRPRTQKSPPKRGQPQPETPTPVNGL